jgi:hypothetical protein
MIMLGHVCRPYFHQLGLLKRGKRARAFKVVRNN